MKPCHCASLTPRVTGADSLLCRGGTRPPWIAKLYRVGSGHGSHTHGHNLGPEGPWQRGHKRSWVMSHQFLCRTQWQTDTSISEMGKLRLRQMLTWTREPQGRRGCSGDSLLLGFPAVPSRRNPSQHAPEAPAGRRVPVCSAPPLQPQRPVYTEDPRAPEGSPVEPGVCQSCRPPRSAGPRPRVPGQVKEGTDQQPGLGGPPNSPATLEGAWGRGTSW